MSFVISILCSNVVLLASDQRVVENNVTVNEQYPKVNHIGVDNLIFMGFSGNKDLAEMS